ncbi:MAG: ankyrin repeat domain-containing protein, partial [Pseudomonadota bacterium]|nr:ankyrin repeat domain-containing protein [Pseudomonadota bacterium]
KAIEDLIEEINGKPIFRTIDDGLEVIEHAVDKENIASLLLSPDSNGAIFIDVNDRNRNGETALMIAVYRGNEGVVKAILDHKKCDSTIINAKDQNGKTALMLAAVMGHTDVVKAILAHPEVNADTINAKNDEGMTALMIAADMGHPAIVKEILAHPKVNADIINSRGDGGRTALMIAAMRGHTDVVKAILAHPEVNAEVINATGRTGMTALMVAVGGGNLEVVKEILAHPTVNINAQDNGGRTALMIAAIMGHTATVKAILAHEKCDIEAINTKSSNGNTALMIAVRMGHTAIVEAILDHEKCDSTIINATDRNGSTALMVAAGLGDLEAVKAILKSKQYNALNAQDRAKFLNAKNRHGNTALKIAMNIDNLKIGEALLALRDDQGKPLININATDESGNTLLMNACMDHEVEKAECLILGKANLDEQDSSGKTALMYACEQQDVQLAKLLIGNRADIYIQDKRNKTAYDYLKQNIKSNEIRELFDSEMKYAKKECKIRLDGLEKSSDISPELKSRIEETKNKFKVYKTFSEVGKMVSTTDNLQKEVGKMVYTNNRQKLERCQKVLTSLRDSSEISQELKGKIEATQQQYKEIKSFSEIDKMESIISNLQKEVHKQAIESEEKKYLVKKQKEKKDRAEKVDQIVSNAKKSSEKKDEVELAEKIKILHTMKLPIDTEILGQYEENGDMQQMKDSLEGTMRKDIARRRKILTGLKENANLSEEVKRQIEKEEILKDDKFLDAESPEFDDVYAEYCKISQIQEYAEKVIAIHASVKQQLGNQENTAGSQESELNDELHKTINSIHRGDNHHESRLEKLKKLHLTVEEHKGKTTDLKASIMEHGKIKQEKENFSSKSLIVALGAIAVAATVYYRFGTGL